MRIEHRPAADLDDLRLAGSLLSEAWRRHGPADAGTPGDLEWWYAQAWPDALDTSLRIWTVDGEPAAWSWFDAPATADWYVPPALRGGPLEEAILDWALAASGDSAITVGAPDSAAATIALLERRGFAPSEEHDLSQYVRRLDGRPLPVPDPPPGHRVRPVAGPDELEARVGVHRAAFVPSRMTVDKYRRLVTLPHYRFEHDLVAETPDGTLVAFAMCWWDPVGRVGEFEPVGTDPHHRRQGLARAVLASGLRLFEELGAEWALVFSGTANEASEALYRSVGFERLTLHRRWARPGTIRP